MAILSATDSFRASPNALRSSDIQPIPFFTASCGVRIWISSPFLMIFPCLRQSAPKTNRASSVRPAPISPPMPRISPFRSLKEAFFIAWDSIPCTSSSTGASAATLECFFFSQLTSLPTIERISSGREDSLVIKVLINAPSRITVMRSVISNSSSRRCEI